MALLEVRGVGVRFGGLAALTDVGLTVEAGTVVGLIGPNGAGKTTLFNVISGLQQPNSGRVLFDDRDVSQLSAHQRARLGLARTFQRLETFASLSARDNILVAAEIRKRWAKDRQADPPREAEEIIDLVGIRSVADTPVDSLPTGLARLVELGRALAVRPRLVLLDEPSSGLDETESEDLGRLLVRLAGTGVAVLLVEHDVELVMQVCERIFVLDFGKLLASGTPGEIQGNAAVQAAYLGVGEEAGEEIGVLS
ncbi:MAG TPA: ABC transporter ATP-binding protein [Acidimicrobiales bacterium]|nr:ABC transporter ATP-binding protein [Acidimicrobiales bacterium]